MRKLYRKLKSEYLENKMRIGILTVPFNNNYGGLLQAYALKTVLVRLGHEVIFLNRQRNPMQSLKFRIYRILVKLHIIDDFLEKRIVRISVNTDSFKKRWLSPITEPFYSTKDLNKVLDLGIDFFIVGSDQVWRYLYAEDSIDDYFFNLLDGKNIPRMSYAASFGTEVMEYPEDKVPMIKHLLSQFIGISVREESGKELLVNYFGQNPSNVKVVVDPTLIIPKEIYISLFEQQERERDKYIFTYILDKELISDVIIEEIAASKGAKRIDLSAQTGNISNLQPLAPVERWLQSICYADYVITDSFHGTVFSIIFNRPFIVVANPARGITRLCDLLKKFELEDRLVNEGNSLPGLDLDNPIDWDHVNKRIMQYGEESLSFLTNCLKAN